MGAKAAPLHTSERRSGASPVVLVGGDAAALPQGRAVLQCLVQQAHDAERAAVPGDACPGQPHSHFTPCPPEKPGFCPARAGMFPSYDCRAWCWHDAGCPGEEKCCLRGCDYVCLPPARGASHSAPAREQWAGILSSCGAVGRHHPVCPQLHCLLSPEKPSICPVATEAPAAAAPCGIACAGDWQCPGNEKCCSSTCGRVCSAPERGEDTGTGAAGPHGHDGNAPLGQDMGQCCCRAGTAHRAGGARSAGGACPCRPFTPLRQTRRVPESEAAAATGAV